MFLYFYNIFSVFLHLIICEDRAIQFCDCHTDLFNKLFYLLNCMPFLFFVNFKLVHVLLRLEISSDFALGKTWDIFFLINFNLYIFNCEKIDWVEATPMQALVYQLSSFRVSSGATRVEATLVQILVYQLSSILSC